MKKLLFIVALITFTMTFSQEKRIPSMVILSPQETIIDKALDSIAQSFEQKADLSEAHKEKIREINGENFRQKSEMEILFIQKLDLGSYISYGLNFYISYKLFEYHENHMVFPAHESNDSTAEGLKQIAEKHQMNWVLNIPKVEFKSNEQGKSGTLRFQLYNHKFNEIVLDEVVSADDQNPGFEFTCDSGSINCVTNNLTSAISYRVLGFLNKNRKYWQH